MLVFTTSGRIFKTITTEKLDDAMKEDVHGRGNGYLFILSSTVIFKQ